MIRFFSFFLFLLAGAPLFGEEAPPLAPRQSDLTQTFIMVAIAGAFFYFILIRPEQKRRQELDDQRAALKKGDKVTAMGIVGTVSQIKEDTVILKMVDGSKIEFLNTAISDVLNGSEEKTVPLKQ